MNCRFPEHHRPSSGGDSSAALAWVAILAIIITAAVSPAVHGLITDVLWAVGASGVAVVAITVTVLVVRWRRRRARRSVPAAPVVVVLTETQVRDAVRSGDFLRAIASARRDVSALSRSGVPTYVVTSDDDGWGRSL